MDFRSIARYDVVRGDISRVASASGSKAALIRFRSSPSGKGFHSMPAIGQTGNLLSAKADRHSLRLPSPASRSSHQD